MYAFFFFFFSMQRSLSGESSQPANFYNENSYEVCCMLNVVVTIIMHVLTGHYLFCCMIG